MGRAPSRRYSSGRGPAPQPSANWLTPTASALALPARAVGDVESVAAHSRWALHARPTERCERSLSNAPRPSSSVSVPAVARVWSSSWNSRSRATTYPKARKASSSEAAKTWGTARSSYTTLTVSVSPGMGSTARRGRAATDAAAHTPRQGASIPPPRGAGAPAPRSPPPAPRVEHSAHRRDRARAAEPDNEQDRKHEGAESGAEEAHWGVEARRGVPGRQAQSLWGDPLGRLTLATDGRDRILRSRMHTTNRERTVPPDGSPVTAPRPAGARNLGVPLELDWIREIRVNRSAGERRAG